MSERINVQEAFDPELRRAQEEMDIYTENRPYEDENGNVRSPDGAVVNAESYFDEQRSIAEETSDVAYEDMSMPDLARKLADAEHNNDRTTAENVNDALLEKLAAEEEKYLTAVGERGAENNDLRGDQLWNRVMSIKDKELERLSGKDVITDTPKSPDTDSGKAGGTSTPETPSSTPNTTPSTANTELWGDWAKDQEGLNVPTPETPDAVPPTPPELTDELRAQLPPMPPVPEGATASKAAEQGDGKPEDGTETDPSEAETAESESIDPTPKGIRARMKAKLQDVKQKLNDLYYGTGAKFTTEYDGLRNQGEEKEYRNKLLAGAVGVVAVGAAALAIHKGISFENPLDSLPSPDSAPDTSHLPDVNHGPTGTETAPDTPDTSAVDKDAATSAEADAAEKVAHKEEIAKRTFTLAEGDTIWGQSEEMLTQYGIEVTNENIDIVKDAVLDKYSITEIEARSLPVGAQYTVPQEVIEELLKK